MLISPPSPRRFAEVRHYEASGRNRREFVAGLGSAAACPVMARAQPRNPIKRIAFIAGGRGVIDPIFRQSLHGSGGSRGGTCA